MDVLSQHPVPRTMRRLLVGVAACVAILLALYVGLGAVTGAMNERREQFHAPARGLSAELAATLQGMRAPNGVAPDFVDRLESEAAFVGSVSRDAVRATALLQRLLALHREQADPAFEAATRRIDRALVELREIEREFEGDPKALARAVALRPLYAMLVAEQLARQHRAAELVLLRRQHVWERVFGGVFAVVAVLLLGGFGVAMRRSLHGVDEVLAQERRSLLALEASRAALQEAQALARLGNWELDLRHGRWWWSVEMYRLFEREPGTGAPSEADWLAAVVAEDRPRLQAALDTGVARGGDPATAMAALGALRLEVGHGGVRYIALHARLDRDAQGVPVRLLGTAQDVTERRLAEEALARSRDDLERLVAERTAQLTAARDAAERANRAKSEFLSRMSHELRTPMNAVLGFAQLIGFDSSLSPKAREYVDQVLRAGNHLLHLINDVLDLSHVESGRLTLSPEPIAVEALVQEVIALMVPVATEHHVRLTAGPLGALAMRGDRLRVKQVLLNLVSNAVKYNRPEGWVHIGATASAPGRVRLQVSDSGQGITPAGLTQLFEPFNRLGAETGLVEGTGIGLSISKRLVEMMGGTIGVDSRSGGGSRFWFDLPDDRLAAPPAALAPATPVVAVPRADEAVVLYVEDNTANLVLVQEIVSRHPGVRLITAPSGRLGLDLARTQRLDLILLDIHLPDMSGYKVLEQLRALESTRDVPVLALTANAMPGEDLKALGAGFNEFVTKPIDVPRFDALLSCHLAGRELPRA